MNKKAIMIKFLVTVVLAILIFIPACAFVTKFFFRLSAQGEDSFRDLVAEVKDVAEQADGEQRTFVLKMDEETVLMAFKTGRPKLFSLRKGSDIRQDVEAQGLDYQSSYSYVARETGDPARLEYSSGLYSSDLPKAVGEIEGGGLAVAQGYIDYFFSRPASCQNAPCLCLCRELTQQDVQFHRNYERTLPELLPRLEADVDLGCESGKLVCDAFSDVEFQQSVSTIRLTKSDPRRIPLRIKKEAGKVVLEELS